MHDESVSARFQIYQGVCEQGLQGMLCPGEECSINGDCASTCCAGSMCDINGDGSANCSSARIPYWAIILLVSAIVLVIVVAVILICWLKRRHEEDILSASRDVVSKDEQYERMRRSTISLRRSLVSLKSPRDIDQGKHPADINELLLNKDYEDIDLPISRMSLPEPSTRDKSLSINN